MLIKDMVLGVAAQAPSHPPTHNHKPATTNQSLRLLTNLAYYVNTHNCITGAPPALPASSHVLGTVKWWVMHVRTRVRGLLATSSHHRQTLHTQFHTTPGGRLLVPYCNHYTLTVP